MQKICSECGGTIDSFVFIFQPLDGVTLLNELKEMFPDWNFTLDTVAGKKVRIKTTEPLDTKDTDDLIEYFISKGYIEDSKQEKKEVYG